MEDKTPTAASPEYDHLLMISALLLLGLGLVMVFSASGVLASDKYHDPAFFLKKQLIYAVAGRRPDALRPPDSLPVYITAWCISSSSSV